MAEAKVKFDKAIWRILTPNKLYVYMSSSLRNGFWSALYEQRGGRFSSLIGVLAELQLRSGRLILYLLENKDKQTPMDLIQRDSKEFRSWNQGEFVTASAADPVTQKVVKEIKKIAEPEKYPIGHVITTKIQVPKDYVRIKGDVTYIGWKSHVLKVHSLDKIHSTVKKAITTARHAWSWEPKNLRILVHTSTNAMGLAFNPGKGNHVISLKSILLKEYDLTSINRVILHEFCHHYREETFGRHRLETDMHDDKFCTALRQVDPVVESLRECKMFTDDQWVESPEVQKKAKKQKGIFDPYRGYGEIKHLKSGILKLHWLPYKKGDFKRQVLHLNSDDLKKITNQIPRSRWQDIKIIHDTRLPWIDHESNFKVLINVLSARFPQHGFRELLK